MKMAVFKGVISNTHIFENLAEVFFSSLSLHNCNATSKNTHLLSIIPVLTTTGTCLRYGFMSHNATLVYCIEENLHTSFAKEFFSLIAG
jgi:hypothetical protein